MVFQREGAADAGDGAAAGGDLDELPAGVTSPAAKTPGTVVVPLASTTR
jgi:hypothetical protein